MAPYPLRRVVPWSLVFLRLALAPVVLWGAKADWSGLVLSVLILIALLSDMYDGVLARKLGCATAAIRVADSLVDTVFYLAVLGALWIRRPKVVLELWVLLVVLLALEASRYVVDFRKFGRSSSYHSYLAKTWGLVMAIAVMVVFAFQAGAMLLAAALVLGILCNLEGLIMSAVLPEWHHDVKTISQALRLRRSSVYPASRP